MRIASTLNPHRLTLPVSVQPVHMVGIHDDDGDLLFVWLNALPGKDESAMLFFCIRYSTIFESNVDKTSLEPITSPTC